MSALERAVRPPERLECLSSLEALYRSLVETQFTFRKYAEEWVLALRDRLPDGASMGSLLDLDRDSASGAWLFALAVHGSLVRLNRKWGLGDSPEVDLPLRRLGRLVAEASLSPEETAALVLGDRAALQA